MVNVASPELWEHVERLAPLTGACPVPEAERPVHPHERDKFAAAALTPAAADLVKPPRVAECARQLEAGSAR